MSRPAQEVLADHLDRRAVGDIEGDLATNYAPDVVLLCEHGAFEGREAVRNSAEQLAQQLPKARQEIICQVCRDNYALVIWRAEADGIRAEHGADSFVIRDGRIVMQSVFYQLREKH